MDLIRLLVALHPRDWRERYGEEFAALLEDTRLTPAAVLNVAVRGAGLRVRARQGTVLLVAALVVSVASEIAAQLAGLAANILWLPTSPLRALALLGAVGPWAVLIVWARARRRSARCE
ncbi:MAG TPA: hypothetical protein VMH35_03140 [Streptosporangiaceae bacterium]|nr:hypothetical protein [Streptosporangiaceae bacterium]